MKLAMAIATVAFPDDSGRGELGFFSPPRTLNTATALYPAFSDLSLGAEDGRTEQKGAIVLTILLPPSQPRRIEALQMSRSWGNCPNASNFPENSIRNLA